MASEEKLPLWWEWATGANGPVSAIPYVKYVIYEYQPVTSRPGTGAVGPSGAAKCSETRPECTFTVPALSDPVTELPWLGPITDAP